MTGLTRPMVLSVTVLAVAAAGLGVLWARATQPVSESAVINAMAARYVAETGGQETDCAARPSDHPEVWLIVECRRGDALYAYPVAPSGRAISVERYDL